MQVSFRCPAPKGERADNDLFGTPVEFAAHFTKVAFAAEYLSVPINRNEAALARFLKQSSGNLLVGYNATDNLTGKVRNRLVQMPVAH